MYSPKVAVVDSGVDTQNQEIMEHVIQGFSKECRRRWSY